MPRLYRKRKAHGLPPGTLSASEQRQAGRTVVSLIDYDSAQIQEKILSSIEDCFRYRHTDSVSWINIDNPQVEAIQRIDANFGVHPLVLEDILNRGQRPKIDDYGDYMFLVLKMIHEDKEHGDLFAEQISIVLGKNFVLSFQEDIPGDIFDGLRQRIRESKGKIRQSGADYLVYSIIDAIVDRYFILLERLGEQIDQLETEVLNNLDKSLIKKIYRLKTQVIYLRKQVWPLRDVIGDLMRRDSPLMSEATKVYLRDVYDHTVNVNETLEAFRDALSGLHDIYLSSISNKMNEVMQFLTVFTTVFIPLNFIAGVYGMNFAHMPELRSPYGYFVTLGVMAAIALGLILYFKRKKWV